MFLIDRNIKNATLIFREICEKHIRCLGIKFIVKNTYQQFWQFFGSNSAKCIINWIAQQEISKVPRHVDGFTRD